MPDKIYTIPINEAFERADGCPVCAIYDDMESKELSRILGAAMMEPDVRIETNRKGFCARHYGLMYKEKNRLSLALMLETHLDELRKKAFRGFSRRFAKDAGPLSDILASCYLCERVEGFMDKMYQNLCWLYEHDRGFSLKLKAQPYFCLPHYEALLRAAFRHLSRSAAADFANTVETIEKDYLETLSGDVKWFCKKFDYRFKDEDWKNSKDAVERAIYILSGEKDL